MNQSVAFLSQPLPGRDFKKKQNRILKSGVSWLQDKQEDDDLSQKNLWRLHGKLYDFQNFIDKHPGGQHWLITTRNSDITDYFETFHLEDPNHQQILQKYYVGEDKNYNPNEKPYDYKPDGFYKTLKRRLYPLLRDSKNRRPDLLMHIQCALLFAIWIFSFHLMATYRSMLAVFFAGMSLNSLVGIGHNFLHQRDSLWYYAMDFSVIPSKDWIVSHAISHHTYTHLKLDLEITVFEPFINFLTSSPENPKFMAVCSFIVYFLVPLTQTFRVFREVAKGLIKWRPESLLCQLQIIVFILVYKLSIWQSLVLWYCMHAVSIMLLARFANHRIQGAWTDGDPGAVLDFGEHILQTTFDHNRWLPPFLSLFFFTGFNNHVAHHLLPTVDLSQLQRLGPVIEATVKEFGLEQFYKPWNYRDMYMSTFKFLIREQPKKYEE